jgi:hypothetical protein
MNHDSKTVNIYDSAMSRSEAAEPAICALARVVAGWRIEVGGA